MTTNTYENQFNNLVEDDDDFEEEEDLPFDGVPYDPATQVLFKYGTESAVITPDGSTTIYQYLPQVQPQLGFRFPDEISVRDNYAFVPQHEPPVLGTVYTLAAVGDSKGC